MLTFEDFFRKKKIDLLALEKAEPSLFSEFKTHYEQMGEKSFDHTKKFWFNKLRLSYHLAPEPKAEKVIIENQLAEQTITETLEETAPPANVGFKPRFKAGMAKPVEKPAESTEPSSATPAPALGFKPKFKAGVTKSAAPAPEPKLEEAKESSENTAQSTPAPAMGFKPRFKAGVTKSAAPAPEPKPEEAKESSENTAPSTPAPAMGFKPRFKAGVTKNAPSPEEQKEEPKETPAKDNPADSGESKPAYKPRFNMKNMKPKGEE